MDFRGTGRRGRKGQVADNCDLDQGYYNGTKEKCGGFDVGWRRINRGQQDLMIHWICDQE